MKAAAQNQLLQEASKISHLKQAHSWLFDRVRQLKNQYGDRPVYLLEHGLSDQKLDELTGWLRDHLKRITISCDDGDWRHRYLPLLVVATENGYQYGGSNPEFWPPLQERLGQDFTADERYAIRYWFKQLKKHTGTAPIINPWSEQFSNIAWPITHAVLPRRLHVPLFQGALRISTRVTSQSETDAIVDPLSAWAATHSPALAYFLDNRELAADFIKGLLCGADSSSQLTPSLLQRIVSDVRASEDALRALSAVRRRQSYLKVGRRRSRSSKPATPTAMTRPRLFLRCGRAGRRELAVMLPKLPEAVVEPALKKASRFKLRPFGSRRRVLARPLLQGQITPVHARSLQLGASAAPLFPDLSSDDVSGDKQLQFLLSALSVDLDGPLVFTGGLLESVAPQVGHTFLSDEQLWLLTPASLSPVAGVRELDYTVAGLKLSCVNTREEDARAVLETLGLAPISRPGVRFCSFPTLSGSRVRPLRQTASDPIVLRVEGSTVQFGRGGKTRQLSPGLWRLPSLDGAERWELYAEPLGGSSTRLKIDIGAPAEPDELVSVSVIAEELSIDVLQRKQLGARLSSALPLEGIRLSVGLWLRGERVAQVWSEPLPPLPHVLSQEHPIWEQLLLIAGASERWTAREAMTLRLEASGLGEADYWLEPAERAAWWEGDKLKHDGRYAELEVHQLACAAPLHELDPGGSVAGVVLEQPLRVVGGRRVPVLGLGRCTFSGEPSLLPLPAQPGRILRRLEGPAQRREVSAWDVVQGYLCWSTAVGTEQLAEGRRRGVAEEVSRWLVVALCGPRWERQERAVELQPLGRLVLERLKAAGLAEDTFSTEAIAAACGLRGLRQLRDSLITSLGASRELLQEIAPGPLQEVTKENRDALGELDLLFNSVHHEVLAQCLGLSTEDGVPREAQEADICCHRDRTPKVIRDALAVWRGQSRLHILLGPLRPDELSRTLEQHDYDGEELDELAKALVPVLKASARGAPREWRWDQQTIALILRLWLSPSTLNAGSPDLIEAIRLALVDRIGSRAVRYAALRRQIARRGEL